MVACDKITELSREKMKLLICILAESEDEEMIEFAKLIKKYLDSFVRFENFEHVVDHFPFLFR